MNTQIILDRLVAGPDGQRILAELDAETLEERRRLASEITALNAELEKTLVPLRALEGKALEAVKAAEEALQQARQRYQQTAGERRSAVSRHDRERTIRVAQLIETAPEAVTAFQRELEQLGEQVRRTGISTGSGGRHWLTRQALPGTSNYATIIATVAAIGEARSAAEALKLEALTGEEVAGKIAELRESIAKAGAAA